MTYELAKQLKDAGFPQCLTDDSSTFLFADGSKMAGAYPTELSDELSKVSTLSELIEACGDKFFVLKRIIGGWATERMDRYDITADTPEEAVAKLWLELNKK